MNVVPKFTAHVENGKLKFSDPSAFHAFLWKFKPEHELDVVVKRRRKQRSTKQNSWYWGGILPVISHETGHTSEELHEIFKRKFLKRKVIKYRDQEFPVPGSTADCNTMEFSEYIERIRAEAADLGIAIPEASAFADD